jgi:hypothetical protein
VSAEQTLKECLSDPMWRLTSGKLYKIMIKGDDGEEDLSVPFIPNESQLKLFDALHTRNIILKARQLGFTTAIAIYFLDCALFRADVRAAIVAQSEDIAKTIFRDKVQHAYNNLPASLRDAMPLKRDSQSELLFAHNNSSIRVATSARSGTLQYLHVSEFGKICAKFPDRALEVITGSIPAVTSNGVIFIESTAEGQEGAFYDMCQKAIKSKDQGSQLSTKDYRFHFFPWWSEARYRLDPEGVVITAKDHEYFEHIEQQEGCLLSMAQRAWWVSTRDSDFSGQTEMMWQEYPSTSKEAFQQSTEGCYYTVQMTAARKQGRITRVPHRQGRPVNTFWDIGNSDGTAVWFHQRVGRDDLFIKFIEGWGEPYSHYVSEMQKLGWIWGAHYLPHDAGHVRQGQLANSSPETMLRNLGLKNIVIVPAVEDINHGIQLARDAFSTCWFDEVECKEGIAHLDQYRKQWNRTTERYMGSPRHDIHSEGADAFRQFAQGYTGDIINTKPHIPQPIRPIRAVGRR